MGSFFPEKDIVFYGMDLWQRIALSPRSNPLFWALHMGRAFCFSDDRVEELQLHLEVTAGGPPPPPKGTNTRTRLNKVTNNFQCLILAIEKPFFFLFGSFSDMIHNFLTLISWKTATRTISLNVPQGLRHSPPQISLLLPPQHCRE